MNLIKDKVAAREIINKFCADEKREVLEDDEFFSSVSTEWRGGLEELKKLIANSKSEYVSFDIFDTLINRPFDDPADLFYLMDREFEQLLNTNLEFHKVRLDAEAYARRKMGVINSEWEDVTIDEIYDSMSELYHIPLNIAELLREREKGLEIEFCEKRSAGQELFRVAQLTGKKVIVISDMYLKQDTIKTILERNGYADYDKLYLSSEVRLTKYTGNLFEFVKDELNLNHNTQIYHIGDNWQSDFINAKKAGFIPLFFPKAKEVFENKINGVCTNNCSNIAENGTGIIVDKDEIRNLLGYRCMIAMVYNRYFDNPYRTFHPESDFNIDPNFIGYYTVGMHMVGLASWIISQCRGKNIGNIHFLARDGFLPMKAYDILAQDLKGAPKSNYLYASRKAVMCGMVQTELDFYGLPIEYRNHSPQTLLEILKFAAGEYKTNIVEHDLKSLGLDFRTTFKEKWEYFLFLDYFVKHLYDHKILKKNQDMARKYYSAIKKDDVAFDMGYSGRIQNAISNLVGYGVDVLFVHSDTRLSSKMQRRGNYKISNFYDFVPFVSGLLREHLLSDCKPACIGFCEKNEEAEAVLEQEVKNFQDQFIVTCIQSSAIRFVKDFKEIFGSYLKFLPFKVSIVSLPFEGYIRNARYIDRKMFAASYFEDLVYGACNHINIEKFINTTIPYSKSESNRSSQEHLLMIIQDKGFLSKSLICFLADKQMFKYLAANKLKRNAALYRLAKKVSFIYDKLL